MVEPRRNQSGLSLPGAGDLSIFYDKIEAVQDTLKRERLQLVLVKDPDTKAPGLRLQPQAIRLALGCVDSGQ